ncbi:hypothetical protein BDV23DRAFT_170550 [Aspergillus alliaceus]|uniref:Rhodopsin domain-containing protein n=1 Tax=Petromyces alliaceus TaxID=209559 RepID=A0A5N7CFF3_PETAA|nr:hypothetical protein BDV23DRAFT_170550 [Aspergillus alliaceus]
MSDNYVNEVTFVTVLWICQTITFFFVLIRLVLQYRIDRQWHTNDVLILAAWLLALSNGTVWSIVYKQLFQVLALSEGPIDLSHMPPNIGWTMKRYLRGQLASYLLSYTSLWLIKLSFIFFFRKLGNRYRTQRVLWWGVLVFVIACYGGTLGILDYECEMASLENSIERCTSAHSIWYERVSLKVATTMDIVSDAAIIILSGNVMWKVQINLTKKVALIGVSFLTAFIIIIALVRLLLSVSGTGILNPAWLVMWNAVEICVAFIVSCLASFWTFYTKLKRASGALNRRGTFSPNGNYNSLETPILLSAGVSERDKSRQSTMSIRTQSSTRDKLPDGVSRGLG